MSWTTIVGIDPGTRAAVFRRGNYVVRASDSEIFFDRIVPPRCTGRILRFEDYTIPHGELFFGADSECIVNLTWAYGEPDEIEFLRIVGEFEEELDGWRTWDASK